MNTKIIELRLAIKALPTTNTQIQLAVKAEVLRLSEELDKLIELSNVSFDPSEPELPSDWIEHVTPPSPEELVQIDRNAMELAFDLELA